MKGDTEYSKLEQKILSKNGVLIEKTLESFGLKARIAEIRLEKSYTEYCLEIVMGTNLDDLEKHARDIALAVASPTGKVDLVIPIPGRSLVGIRVPKYSREYLNTINNNYLESKDDKLTWQDYVAFIFIMISKFSELIAGKIIRTKK